MSTLEPWATWKPPAHILKRGIAGPDAIRAFILVQELLRDHVRPECIQETGIQQAAGVQFHYFAKDQFAVALPFWEQLRGTPCGKKS